MGLTISEETANIKKILVLMREGPVRAEDCEDRTGLRKETIHAYLCWLAAHKLIVRIERGLYRLEGQQEGPRSEPLNPPKSKIRVGKSTWDPMNQTPLLMPGQIRRIRHR